LQASMAARARHEGAMVGTAKRLGLVRGKQELGAGGCMMSVLAVLLCEGSGEEAQEQEACAGSEPGRQVVLS
jgi:hypothetical protein